MSGEDENTKVETPEVETGSAESKPDVAEKKDPVSNGEDKEAKKPVKRKANVKKVKEVSDSEEEEEKEKSSQKKKQPASSPAKKSKKKESSDEEEEEVETKKPTKKPTSPKKGSKDAVSDGDEDEDEEPPKKGVPLLDQPLEVSGSRERKKVARFAVASVEKEEKKPFAVPAGNGAKLGDIALIENSISKSKPDGLKSVSKALFGSRGPVKTLLKKSIRSFNGYDFAEGSDQWEKRKVLLNKAGLKQLKEICQVLCLERSGTVASVVERIMKFCEKPTDNGKKPKTKAKQKTKAAKKASKPKSKKVVKSKRGKKASEDEESEPELESDEDDGDSKKESAKDESDEDEGKNESDQESKSEDEKETEDKKSATEDDEEEEEEEEEKPKRGRKAPVKKAPVKTTKKAPPKKAPAKKKTSDSEKEDEDLSDDEPLVKVAKPQSPPSDEDIKSYVKKILEGANLEEITMKTVCQQVYENYSDHDLAHKKNLIKDTVKSIISP